MVVSNITPAVAGVFFYAADKVGLFVEQDAYPGNCT